MTASEAKRAYEREYRKKNRERLNAYRREWNRKNPDKVKAYVTKYWEKKGANTDDNEANKVSESLT